MKWELTGLAGNSLWGVRKSRLVNDCRVWDESLTEMGKDERKEGSW